MYILYTSQNSALTSKQITSSRGCHSNHLTKNLAPQMPPLFFLFLGLSLALGFPNLSSSIVTDHEIPHRKLGDNNFDALRKLIVENTKPLTFVYVQKECMYTLQGIWAFRSDYLQRSGYFFPPANASKACWESFESLIPEYIPGFIV